MKSKKEKASYFGNLGYEIARNRLIPSAEQFANLQCDSQRIKGERRSETWNRLFHGEMNRLVKNAGI